MRTNTLLATVAIAATMALAVTGVGGLGQLHAGVFQRNLLVLDGLVQTVDVLSLGALLDAGQPAFELIVLAAKHFAHIKSERAPFSRFH